MDISLIGLYPVSDGQIGDMAYEPLSNDTFRWQPTQEQIDPSAPENANMDMRILYCDPDGRFIVYGPNVPAPDLANIIINPDHFAEIADEENKEVTQTLYEFYKITDAGLQNFLKTMPNLPSRSDIDPEE